MELETKKIKITFTVGHDSTKEELNKLCKEFRAEKYEINECGDFDISFYINTILKYGEAVTFIRLIHIDLEETITKKGFKYKGLRWTPNDVYKFEGGMEDAK